jgi:hypothetical protein
MSIAMFIMIAASGRSIIADHDLNDWYKFSNVLFINMLNLLNLSVGLLYWKASRAYFKYSGITIPTFLGNGFKITFYFVYAVNMITIIGFFTFVLITSDGHIVYNED